MRSKSSILPVLTFMLTSMLPLSSYANQLFELLSEQVSQITEMPCGLKLKPKIKANIRKGTVKHIGVRGKWRWQQDCNEKLGQRTVNYRETAGSGMPIMCPVRQENAIENVLACDQQNPMATASPMYVMIAKPPPPRNTREEPRKKATSSWPAVQGGRSY